MVLSASPNMFALVEACGVPALPARDVAAAGARIAGLRASEIDRPVVVVDPRDLDADAASIAAELLSLRRELAPVLVLVTPDARGALADPVLRRLYATAAPVPPTAQGLATALDIARTLRVTTDDQDTPAAASKGVGPSRRILVAEDNRTNQKVIEKILERAGHVVELVDDGEAALDALAEGGFDLVLMDVNMPVLNGIEATKLYRFASLGDANPVPIVGLTADASEEARRRCREAGMTEFVTKPVKAARLIEVVETLTAGADEGGATVVEFGAGAEVEDAIPHLRLVSDEAPSVDPETLKGLLELGGDEFLKELVDQFLSDASDILRSIAGAVEAKDLQSFRDEVHALRSSSANIGARRIYEMCLGWRMVPADQFGREGADYVDALTSELRQVHDRLRREIDRPAGTPHVLRSM